MSVSLLVGVGLANANDANESPDTPASLLQRIVELRDLQAQEAALRPNASHAEEAKLQLLHARARLAQAEGDAPRLERAWDEIIAVMERRARLAKHSFEAGRINGIEMREAEIRLLESKLDALRSRSG